MNLILLLTLLGGAYLFSRATRKPTKVIENVRMTMYFVVDLENGNVPIFDKQGNEIARISGESLARLRLEGTGRLADGRIVNFVDGQAWDVLPANSWGYGHARRPLKPGASIAVDISLIPIGSKIFIRQWNLWVTADDTGSAISGKHIDLFVGNEPPTVLAEKFPANVTLEVYS